MTWPYLSLGAFLTIIAISALIDLYRRFVPRIRQGISLSPPTPRRDALFAKLGVLLVAFVLIGGYKLYSGTLQSNLRIEDSVMSK